MAVCEHCGNEYDKSFQVIMSGKTHNFAASRSWATAWRKRARSIAATTVPKRKECRVCAIGSNRPWCGYAFFEGIFDPRATEA
jgi:hypothetical protein